MIHNIINQSRWQTICTPATPVVLPVQLPAPPSQPIVPPVEPIAPPIQPIQPAHMPQLNWSHFKPEFAGKPDEDVEAHLCRTDDWMDYTCFPRRCQGQVFLSNISRRGKVMVQIIKACKCRLEQVTNQFWQQYSKIGITREQLFHAWRSFHFDENTEMLRFLCYMH